jgi:RNA polymerase sigma-70 factor (ECF subfamily)
MADADDVVQACLEKAMRNMHQWQEGTRLDSWMMTIARNCWIDDRRAARNRNPHDDIDDYVTLAGDDGEAVVHQRARDRAVRAAIAELPEDQRLIIATVILEGHAYREAAEILGIPLGTVMSRLSRAKAALATRLADMGAN